MRNDIEIREATTDDAPQLAELNVRSWRYAYRGIIHQSFLDHGLDVHRGAQRHRDRLSKSDTTTYLAFNRAALAGFAIVGPSRDENHPEEAEIRALYLDPDYIGQGIGSSLFQRVCEYAVSNDFDKIFVRVLSDNKLGRDFYERMGATLSKNGEKAITIDGQAYREITYEWSALTSSRPQNDGTQRLQL